MSRAQCKGVRWFRVRKKRAPTALKGMKSALSRNVWRVWDTFRSLLIFVCYKLKIAELRCAGNSGRIVMSKCKALRLCVMVWAIASISLPHALAAATKADLAGTWSGTFQSDHSNMEPFTITVVITPDANGHLVG